MSVRLLDLFCGAGGCSVGYARAGFDVIGVDIAPQPNYPYDFHQLDALELMNALLDHPLTGAWDGMNLSHFSAIHASPPCQVHSTQTADKSRHVDLIPPTRELLIASGLPYVIENVAAARPSMIDPVRLCGSSFGLDLHRHRLFETNWPLMVPPCDHSWQTPRFRSLDMKMVRAGRLATVVGVHGHINYPGEREIRDRAMRVDWMTVDELAQAIPPDFTTWIGHQLMAQLAASPVSRVASPGGGKA